MSNNQHGDIGKFLIKYVLPHDPIAMFACAALSMSFNLIGRMAGNYFITLVSTPAPVSYLLRWLVFEQHQKMPL